ncbi:nuclear transport factor 2 family protein [Herbiconiux sp. 11R-BC]|uniref:nuclear transport factor 2 family protein n=1 Tax=Herbiconiux sp. 11R-BC TaxID=3111637 RepID=UPI003C096377
MTPHELIDLHARAFAACDWQAVAPYWHPEAELVSPGGIWPARAMATIMADLDNSYADIQIDVGTVFGSADGRHIALEWTYASTRRSDGARSSTPDAIIVELRDGLIMSWREYFDLSSSVEHGQTPAAEEFRVERR